MVRKNQNVVVQMDYSACLPPYIRLLHRLFERLQEVPGEGFAVDVELISRAAAIEYLMTNMGWYDEDGYQVDDSDDKRAIITDLVNGIPAVDAVPVVHAHWKAYSVPHWTKRYDDNGDPEYKYHNEYTCSICRRRTIIKENYCPACGAKMDGDT